MNDVINILLCGNIEVFDGILTELISIINRTKRIINCYVFTMDATRLNKKYKPISDEMISFLNEVVKAKNIKNKVTKIDVSDLYNKEFKDSPNENAYCTPYTLLRLLADKVCDMPDKLLYLDVDIMFNKDIKLLYDININDYEYAAVKEKYGCWLIRPDYINAGMLLFNMKMIRETNLLGKAREKLRMKKYLFADQSAIFNATSKKKIIPRRFNEQSKFNRSDTVVCHFCKRLLWLPYPHTENYKQWNINEIHKYLKCYTFDKDLNEYLELKKKYEREAQNE